MSNLFNAFLERVESTPGVPLYLQPDDLAALKEDPEFARAIFFDSRGVTSYLGRVRVASSCTRPLLSVAPPLTLDHQREEAQDSNFISAAYPPSAGYAAALRWSQDAESSRASKSSPPSRTPAFKTGDRVEKVSGSKWSGTVCGTYCTDLTPEGYCVESDTHTGGVQIYPAKALRKVGISDFERSYGLKDMPYKSARDQSGGSEMTDAQRKAILEKMSKLQQYEECGRIPVVDADGDLENFVLRIAGKPYRCICGCNVFHKPDRDNLNLYECNACEGRFEAE